MKASTCQFCRLDSSQKKSHFITRRMTHPDNVHKDLFLSLFLSFFVLTFFTMTLFLSKPLQAKFGEERSLEDVVKQAGVNSVWGSPCTVLNVERSVHPYGMKIVTIAVNCDIIKAPPPGYVHPAFGENWVEEGEGQTFRFHMLDPLANHMPELKALPDVGKEFTLCLSGASQIGLSSLCALSDKAMQSYRESVSSETSTLGTSSDQERNQENVQESDSAQKSTLKQAVDSVSTSSKGEQKSQTIDKKQLKDLVQRFYPANSAKSPKSSSQEELRIEENTGESAGAAQEPMPSVSDSDSDGMKNINER
ncbi:MAG: hypothetical protein H7A32_03620 [Deltaproteobacteria bacterium]|nr:hypothetical protein [Deltaproteobacteria bacterium]